MQSADPLTSFDLIDFYLILAGLHDMSFYVIYSFIHSCHPGGSLFGGSAVFGGSAAPNTAAVAPSIFGGSTTQTNNQR